MVLCTYLSVNGALEFSAEGSEGEGAVLVGKVNTLLLQCGLGGGGPSGGRHWEGMHGNLKLGVHGTPLAQDMAGRQPRKQFLGLKVPEGREEAFLFPILAHSLKHHLFSAFAVVYTE